MGTYTGAEQAMVSAWVEAQIKSPTVAAELEALVISGLPMTGLSARVFEDFAPEGTPYPFIIFQCQSPPRDVRGVGTTRVMVDTLYVVKTVAQVMSYAPLAPVAKVLDNAITTSVGGPVADGLVFTAVREEQFALNEIDSGKQYRHFGGVYRIHAQA